MDGRPGEEKGVGGVGRRNQGREGREKRQHKGKGREEVKGQEDTRDIRVGGGGGGR